jgi:hypothetical protein
MIVRANNTSRKANLEILIVISSALLTGIYTANVLTVYADSRILKQDTNQMQIVIRYVLIVLYQIHVIKELQIMLIMVYQKLGEQQLQLPEH